MNRVLLITSVLLSLSFIGAGCAARPTPQGPAKPNPTSTSDVNESPILTQADFGGFGLKSGKRSEPNQTFRVRISPNQPIYRFHVTSFTTSTQGEITIFRGDSTTSTQTIELDPNIRLNDNIPISFNVHDINFDGYADFGVLADGGALWGVYQYWIFDPTSETFITSSTTDDFRTISFNNILFDDKNQQVITYGLLGAVGQEKMIYQYQKGRYQLIDDLIQENIGEPPKIQCKITQVTVDRTGKHTKAKIEDGFCASFIFPQE